MFSLTHIMFMLQVSKRRVLRADIVATLCLSDINQARDDLIARVLNFNSERESLSKTTKVIVDRTEPEDDDVDEEPGSGETLKAVKDKAKKVKKATSK